jgi:hypothetical protein
VNSPPSLSVLIPIIDETVALEETVRLTISNPCLHILEVLLISCQRTTQPTFSICQRLQQEYLGRLRIINQSLPFLGGAFRAGIEVAKGSHILLMFADLESDLRAVPAMVLAAEKDPGAVISASRWLPHGRFIGYGHFKLLLNYCFQRLCALACHCNLTDFTYGFRLYPSAILQNNTWKEVHHAFVLESILKPLLSNVPIREVPAVWVRRQDGRRHRRFRQYSRYLITLAEVLSEHRRSSSLLKKPPGEGTGPTMHADFRANLAGRVLSRGEQNVFQQAASSSPRVIPAADRARVSLAPPATSAALTLPDGS